MNFSQARENEFFAFSSKIKCLTLFPQVKILNKMFDFVSASKSIFTCGNKSLKYFTCGNKVKHFILLEKAKTHFKIF